jgi:hypothetical protein
MKLISPHHRGGKAAFAAPTGVGVIAQITRLGLWRSGVIAPIAPPPALVETDAGVRTASKASSSELAVECWMS